MPDTKKQFINDLEQMGINKGESLLVHASFNSLGLTDHSPADVIYWLMEYLGPYGTLLMPGLSYLLVTPNNPCFHVEKTGSCVGIIPETFRQMEGVFRSIHPTHSVLAWGKHSLDLVANHSLDCTPAGENSPFHLLPQLSGKILMLGCSLNTNTSMHAIEELVGTDYVLGDPLEYVLIPRSEIPYRRTYRTHGFSGLIQRYDRIQYLPKGEWLTKQSILTAKSFLIDAPKLWERSIQK